MSEVKLLPCPFCGGEAEIQAGKNVMCWEQMVVCTECGASIKHHKCFVPSGNRKASIKAWNTRKPMERIMERLEEKAKEYTNDDLSYRIPWFGIEEAIEIVKEEGGIE